MVPVRATNSDELRALQGTELGPSAWFDITQNLVNGFADVTEDWQWIHVDERRAAESPLGSTIAHGLLTLSLGPKFMDELLVLDGFAHALNYGYDRVRFPAPVPVDSRLRMRATISEISDLPGGVQATFTQVFECEGSEKPSCVAEAVARFIDRA